MTGLILVPGAFGQDVPVDLVLRCLGREGFEVLRAALRNTSVFRWVEDEYGNHQLGARQPLEAVTIVNSRFGRQESFEYVKLLLRNIRTGTNWQAFNPETDFAVRLLRAVGPESEVRSPSSDELLDLAGTLADMNANSGQGQNPWLAFTEGHFRREALLRHRDAINWEGATEVETNIPLWVTQYELATAALSRAEMGFSQSSDRKLARSMSRVHTEFAALYGLAQDIYFRLSKSRLHLKMTGAFIGTLNRGFAEAIRHCKQAALYDSENPYSQDVRFRVTTTQLESTNSNTPEVKVELISDLCDILDHSCWRHQLEQFNRRKLELADLLNDDSVREDALEQLATMGSTAGEYMLAWRRMHYPDRTWRPESEIQEALLRIASIEDRADLKLIRLYTQGWWQVFGKIDPYECERATVRITHEQWQHFTHWLRRRLSHTEEESLLAKFLYAWGLFQLRQYRESEEEFRILDRSTMGGRHRVIRLCLWSDDDGTPVICSGTIRRVSEESDKGWVYVPTLRRELIFRPSDFKGQTIHPNQPLQDFHIAFNFRGPIADPVRLSRHTPSSGGRHERD
ncbi:MAG: hypothetical protein KDA52_08210 [Planctomycetaceae bacterium]|nr:hypothetical protein [Planctomycetaceae bacterium]